MTDICRLREARGIKADCDEDECIYWRVANHLDLVPPRGECAIQYFQLLGESGSEIAEWLLSVKMRLGSLDPAKAEKPGDPAASGRGGGAG